NFRRRFEILQKRQVGRELSLDDHRFGGRLRSGLKAPDSAPEADVVRTEQSRMLGIALQRLPDSYRQVVDMHARERKSFDDIGRQLGCSPEAARKSWTRAVKQVAKMMKGYW